MKTSDEMVSSLLERRDAYVTRQKQKRRAAMKIASATCAFALVALGAFGVAKSGWLTPDTPLVDDPAVTAPITKPTEDNGPGIGGDGDDECAVHNLYYHRTVSIFRGERLDAFLAHLGEDRNPEDVNIVNIVEYCDISREEFIAAYNGMWTEENLDEIAWNHGNGCPYTKNQFLDAIYGDDPELTAWVFAPCSTWPMASEWDLLGEEGLVPEEWPPEGYGFGETLPEMEETEE
ncbi:MAG: hypothetical protein IJO42_00480 [Clostridia bacterium]|nr:hypothetical protein [Clostridia bacterium]